MSFYEEYANYKNFDFDAFFERVTKEDIRRILNKNKLDQYDFLALLSKEAENFLEEMAQRAHKLALRHFGKTVLLYTPMYLGNHCVNRCAYCGYNTDNNIRRKRLTLDEIEKEAKAISDTGLRHILILTGESAQNAPVSYIIEATQVLKKYFDSIEIEIYPLKEEEYKQVIDAGVDGLTVYQETYDEEIYDRVHISGPKKNYRFRLDTAERACKERIRSVNIGALLGLDEWRREAFMTGIHADYLQNKYTDVAVSVSFPRMRPHAGAFQDIYPVSDKNLVQNILALKMFIPYVGMTLSTRESPEFRENVIPLGVNKMSAGVSTEVGGHSSEDKGDMQFQIWDTRSVDEMKEVILQKGYQPVFKDWMGISR